MSKSFNMITPPQVVSSVKWLEDELELNALHNPGSRRGSGNEKAAVTQRAALSAALGGRVDIAAMSTISGWSLDKLLIMFWHINCLIFLSRKIYCSPLCILVLFSE